MQKAWQEVERLVRENATHRMGWKLGDAAASVSLAHAGNELSELKESPDDIEELADILGCLIVYAVKMNWQIEDVETALLQKLKIRFKS